MIRQIVERQRKRERTRFTFKGQWAMTLAVSVVLALILFGGACLIYIGLRNVYRGIASEKWPSVDGVASSTRTSSSSKSGSMTSADIQARYTVNGRELTTDTLHFGQTLGSGDSSEAVVRQLMYPLGAKVRVYYNPSSPEVAALESGWSPESLWIPGCGLAVCLVTVMFSFLQMGTAGGLGGMSIGVGMFAAIFMLIGTPMLLSGGLNYYRASASVDWPKAKGQIVYGNLDSSTRETEDEDGNKETSTTHGPAIAYRYEVNGRKYFSNVRRFGQLAGADEDWAAEILERYPLGKDIDVSYNPSRPSVAAIETGVTSELYWLPGAGAAFFLFGLAVAIIIVPRIDG